MTERPTFCQEIRGIACDNCELRNVSEAFWVANAKDDPYYMAQHLKDRLHNVSLGDDPNPFAVPGQLNQLSKEVVKLTSSEQAVTRIDGEIVIGSIPDYPEDRPNIYPTPPEAQMIFNCFVRNQQEGCAP